MSNTGQLAVQADEQQYRNVGVARLLKWIRSDLLAAGGAIVLLFIIIVAVFAPWIAPYPADALNATHPSQTLLAPGAEHWFGTDRVGRDVLSRVIFGARTSLTIASLVLVISVVFGTLVGVIAGYVGGWLRDVIMRITDMFLAFPALLLSVALAMVLRPSVSTVIIAISVTWWPWYARLSVSMASTIKSKAYIDSARCLGQSNFTIVRKHVLPNTLTPIIVQMSLDAGGIILTAASLSYLGLGAKEPVSEWGLMIQQGQALFTTQWWVALFPGLAILVTAFAFNLLGEGLRSSLDIKRKSA